MVGVGEGVFDDEELDFVGVDVEEDFDEEDFDEEFDFEFDDFLVGVGWLLF